MTVILVIDMLLTVSIDRTMLVTVFLVIDMLPTVFYRQSHAGDCCSSH